MIGALVALVATVSAQTTTPMTDSRYQQLATELEARIAAIKQYAQAILARNATLGRKSKLPLWVTDGVAKIASLAYMGEDAWWTTPVLAAPVAPPVVVTDPHGAPTPAPAPVPAPTPAPIPVEDDQWWRWGRPKPSTTPASSLGLVNWATEATYVGSFQIPSTAGPGGYNYNYGRGPMAISLDETQIYAVGSSGGILARTAASFTFPGYTIGGAYSTWPVATFVQSFIPDITNGEHDEVNPAGDTSMVYGLFHLPDGRLLVNNTISYDGANTSTKSIMTRSATLSDSTTMVQMETFYQTTQQGMYSGDCITNIPTAWQSALGGDLLMGAAGLSIISRGSYGPSAASLYAANIDGRATVPGTPLLAYPTGNRTLAEWRTNATNNWGMTDSTGGCLIVPGTRTILYFGAHGKESITVAGRTWCYGDRTDNIALHITDDGDGEIEIDALCYSPITWPSLGHGQYSYPIVFSVWAYDLNDLASVKAGTKQPWEIAPYNRWDLDIPGHDENAVVPQICGVFYKASTRVVHLGTYGTDTVNRQCTVHGYQLPAY